MAAHPNLPRWLSVEQAAEYLGISKSTLDHGRCLGTGPRWRQPRGKGTRVFYNLADLDIWLEKGELPDGGATS